MHSNLKNIYGKKGMLKNQDSCQAVYAILTNSGNLSKLKIYRYMLFINIFMSTYKICKKQNENNLCI